MIKVVLALELAQTFAALSALTLVVYAVRRVRGVVGGAPGGD